MAKIKVAFKYCFLLIIIVLAAGCSEKGSVNPVIREDVYSIGITFLNEMKVSADQDDKEINEKIDELAYEMKVVCIEKNGYKSFSDKEIFYIDTLGEIRVAYDELIFSMNPKYQTSTKERKAAVERFEKLVSDFEKKYTRRE